MILALETSCDETSAALIEHGRVLSNVVSSQIELHAEYGGVVPELAAREHLQNLMPVAREALAQAEVSAARLSAVAATQGPGLPSALMVGLRAAQALAFVLQKPFLGVNHHEAHLFSPWVAGEPPIADFSGFEPNLSLVVSGGHTMLVHIQSEMEHRVLGSTIDDAAGECFDKTGKLMGLPYPAGPTIDRLAVQGDPHRFAFPRPLLNEPNDDFSFSGLKTSVRYFLRDNPAVLDDAKGLRDLCASIQAAIVDVLVTKTMRAAERVGVKCITASGGVTCNSRLRKQLEEATRIRKLRLRLSERSLCTDNAAMVGILAERKLLHGSEPTAIDADIQPNWALA